MADTSHSSSLTAEGEAYWKANLRLIVGCLIVWGIVSFGFGILLRPLLSGIAIGGTDLGFWFAQQGSIYIFIVLTFVYARVLARLEKRLGFEEPEA